MARATYALGPKDDGTFYSRIARRSVRLLKHIPANQSVQLAEVATDVRDREYAEFAIPGAKGFVQIGVDRLRDYLSYLVDIHCLAKVDKGEYRLAVKKPNTDAHWTQALSDLAREHLAELLGVSPADLPDHLEKMRSSLHAKRKVPTLTAVLAETGIEGSRKQEVFRWSLYLYCDGQACALEVRRYPHLSPRV